MNCLRVRAWHPLVCPQRIFKDCYGNSNAYADTNPACYIEPDGSCVILVRQVNYRKFQDRSFTLGEKGKSTTCYHCFRGMYKDHRLDIQSSFPMSVTDMCPKYLSCWHGAEDIRFLDTTRILATYPEYNPVGYPCMVEGYIHGDSMTFTRVLEPSAIEKNWMPFTGADGAPWVVYSVYPLTIKRLDSPTLVPLHTSTDLSMLDGYHGSTNGIRYKDGWLFLVHIYKERSAHRWLYICPKTDNNRSIVAYSDAFVFLPYSYIEFPCSLSNYDDELLIGLGVNDDKAFLVSVDIGDVALLHP